MKAILVPTDFSDCAHEALRLAFAIGLKSGSHLYFLYLFSSVDEKSHVPHMSTHLQHPHSNALEGHAKDKLAKMVTAAEKLGLQATPLFVYDNGTEDILNYIRPYAIDLVVMGSHSSKGIKRLFIGSQAQHMIKHSPVPVLVIKKTLEDLNIRKIVFPSRFKEDVTQSVSKVIGLQKLWNAQISLLFINLLNEHTEESEAQVKMKTVMDQFPEVDFATGIIDTNNEEAAISVFLKDYQCDLVAISKKEYEDSFPLFVKNIAESLVNHERIPVMVV